MEPNFTVTIVSPYAKHLEDSRGDYIALPNGAEYNILLHNGYETRCDADVFVDGQLIGRWALFPSQYASIEGFPDTHRKFTLVRETSHRARLAGNEVGAEENGLVSVIFRPRKKHHGAAHILHSPSYSPVPAIASVVSVPASELVSSTKALPAARFQLPYIPETSPNFSDFSSGVTVPGRREYQAFDTIPDLSELEIDHEKIREIHIRLVVDDRALSGGKYPPRIDRRNSRVD